MRGQQALPPKNPAIEHARERLTRAQAERERLSNVIAEETLQVLKLALKDVFRNNEKLTKLFWSQREGEYDDQGPDCGISLYGIEYDQEIVSYDDFAWRNRNKEWPDGTEAVINEAKAFLHTLDADALIPHFGGYSLVSASRDDTSYTIESEDYDGWYHENRW
jgi:hypothetical protein